MSNISIWQAINSTQKPTRYQPLQDNIEIDVAIVGGGITGLTAANELLAQGKTVCLLEADQIGSGTTGNSTGNLYIPVQPYYQNIINNYNLETAKLIALSRRLAIDYIENNATSKQIECGFSRRPWYIFTNDVKRIKFLEQEIQSFKDMALDIKDTTFLPLPMRYKKAAVLEHQAHFNPLSYVLGLAADLYNHNLKVYEQTRVIDIVEHEDHCVLFTNKHTVHAKKVIIATHTPIGINTTQLFIAPYRSYVIAVRTAQNSYPDGLYWDVDQPHHALSTHSMAGADPDILLVAGSHHKTGHGVDTNCHYQEIEHFISEHFPNHQVEFKWSAQHYQPADGIPYIGLASRSSKHRYIATGFSADGLIYGIVAGRILAQMICKNGEELPDVFDNRRFAPMAQAAKFTKDNIDVFIQYLKDLPLLTSEYKELKRGQGKVIQIDGEKCAIARDLDNKVHVVSAVCTHMKCIVNWNNAEQTWDCPCHGSRFSPEGRVVEGPAIQDLPKKDHLLGDKK